jgi:phytoene desaturase
MRIIVVGAGLGGLGAAMRLQGAGHDVVVVEARERPGGRAYQLKDEGFTWDTGPSLVTMPWVLEETFAAGGLDLHSEVTLRRLDPLYRIRWAGEGEHFDFADDPARLRAEVAKFSAADAAQVEPFLAALEPIYRDGILAAGRRPFLSATDFAKLVPSMVRLDALRPLHSFV